MATGGRKRGRKKKKKTKKMSKNIGKLSKRLKASLQLRHQPTTKLIPALISAISSAHSFLLRHDLHLLPHQSLSLESLISSSSRSLSSLVSLVSLPLPPPNLIINSSSSTTPSCWFHRFLAADSDHLWPHTFGLSKPSFTLLLRLLTPSLSLPLPLPPDSALAATLFRLSHSAPFSALSRRFSTDSPSACRAFYSVCRAINLTLSHLFELSTDLHRVLLSFRWLSLPNCCGVLALHRFPVDDAFLTVQALVDSEGRFLDVSAGWPGTMSPETILRKSRVYKESKEYLNGPSFDLNDGDSVPQYILGDSCFPLLPWLITPYRTNDELSPAQTEFNSVHKKGMELAETAFERLRGRWKLLDRKWNKQSAQAFPFVLVTCCLLHNFLIKCSEAVPDETAEYQRCEDFPVYDGEVDESGKKTRDALASHLCKVNQRE